MEEKMEEVTNNLPVGEEASDDDHQEDPDEEEEVEVPRSEHLAHHVCQGVPKSFSEKTLRPCRLTR